MTSGREKDGGSPIDTRRRLLDSAQVLISRHGFGGTSLQMIADELGFTKAAIYYHFRTRDQLLVALMEPMLHQISQVVEMAESQRTPRVQIDTMVQGFARVVARNRQLAAVMVFDPDVHRILQLQPDWGNLIGRQLALLTQLDSGPTGVVKATAVLTGLAGAATGAPASIGEDVLIQELCEIGRRTMGLRPARRPNTGDSAARSLPGADTGRWKDFLAEA
ncbi:TetR/AcrR family transcriptional regulator [Mycobacterium sp. HM-7]